MKFSSVFTGLTAGFLAITGVVASPVAVDSVESIDPIQKRGSNEIIAAIHDLTAKLTDLNETALDFESGFVGPAKAIGIQIKSNKVSKAIDAATEAAVESEDKFNFASSLDLSLSMLQLLPRILSTLETLAAKEPEFRKGAFGTGAVPLNDLVKKSLVGQKEKSNEFAETLVPKLDKVFEYISPIITVSINEAFDQVIGLFSKEV